MILSSIAWFFDAVQMQIFSKKNLTIFLGQNHIFDPKNAVFLSFHASIEQEWLKVDEKKSNSMIFNAVQMQTFLTIFLTIFWGQNHIFGPKNAIFLTFQASIEQEWLKVDETNSFSMSFRCHSDADIFEIFFDNFFGSKSHFWPQKCRFSIFSGINWTRMAQSGWN